jgi:hypothetical protein
MHRLPDGSGFFIAEIDTSAPTAPPICWNPWSKVVQDHRDGVIHHRETNIERAKRGLPVPWRPEFGETEPFQPPIR